MIKLIVDSNIIFSALLNTNSKIALILLNGEDYYDFYAPKYLRSEIWEHQEKIKKLAKLDDKDFIEVYELVLKNITVLNHAIVDKNIYEEALELCKTIDVDDVPFVAFSKYLNCKLWTGDKKLIKGLKQQAYTKVITTDDLFRDFLEKRSK